MNLIENPSGLRFLESLVRLIENKSEVTKILESINKARDEANRKIAVVGTINEIDRMKGEIATSHAEATSALAEAKGKADAILGKAKERDARESVKQAEATAALAGTRLELDQRDKTITARENEIQKHINRSTSIREEATKLKVDADTLIAKANEQLAIFQQAAASIN